MSVLFCKKTNILPGRFYDQSLLVDSVMKHDLKHCGVTLPKRGLAFHHIIHGLFSRHRILGTGNFAEKPLLLGYLSQLVFMIFHSFCIHVGFKLRKSPGCKLCKDRHSFNINNVFC